MPKNRPSTTMNVTGVSRIVMEKSLEASFSDKGRRCSSKKHTSIIIFDAEIHCDSMKLP